MDQIFEHVKNIVVPGIVLVAIFTFLFTGMERNGKTGFFDVLGDVNTTEAGDNLVHEVPEQVHGTSNPPEVKCIDRVYYTKASISFTDLFVVTIDGVDYSGSDGINGGFKIYLQSVKNKYGVNVLENMTLTDAFASEFPPAMIYDENLDELVFFDEGTYVIGFKIKASNGAQKNVTMTIPVAPNPSA